MKSSRPVISKSASSTSDGADGRGVPTAVESRFEKARTKLNPRRQRLVRAILDSADETCFLSSREMAKRYHVDATTILRTTQVLGYGSFADFATDLRQHFVTRITPYGALKAATRQRRSVTDHIDHALHKALDNLDVLRSDLDRQRVVELAKLIKRSRHVLVVGLDFAASLSYYLAYGLLALGFDAEAPIGSSGNLQYKVEVLTPKDVLVAISFGQCLRDTVQAVQRAHKQGVPTFGITDSNTSPICALLRRLYRGARCQPFISSFLCCADGGNKRHSRGVCTHRSGTISEATKAYRQRVCIRTSLVSRTKRLKRIRAKREELRAKGKELSAKSEGQRAKG